MAEIDGKVMKGSRILSCLILMIVGFGASAWAQKAAPKANWAKFDGYKIRYYEIGNKRSSKALVFVHCWTCNAEFWREQYNAFPGYRVIAMDLPGHGESDKPKTDYSMAFFAKAVDAVMMKAGVKQAVLVGHSMGTPVVRRFYELFPEKTIGLVIVDGELIPFWPREEVEKFFEPLLADYKNSIGPKFLDQMLVPTHAHVRPFIRSSMLATPDYVGISAMRLMNADAYAEHGKIIVPMLAVMAPNPDWPKDLEARYRSIAPKLEYHMMEGVSHFLQLEKPKEFNEFVSHFVATKKLLD